MTSSQRIELEHACRNADDEQRRAKLRTTDAYGFRLLSSEPRLKRADSATSQLTSLLMLGAHR